MLKTAPLSFARNLLILDSREAIVTVAPLLAELAARCGQAAAMHWLPYFLDSASRGHRVPRLVLMLRPEGDFSRGLRAEDLEAAALFFEYQICGVRTGAVATADAVGFSSVIAPWSERSRFAALAARALLDRGASAVLATYEGFGDAQASHAFADASGVLLASRQRRVARTLCLSPTLDETLAQMGRSTRANMRRYRRRLERQVACEFVPDASAALRGADLGAINDASLNPLSLPEFKRRIHAASELPGSFLSGLRAADGRWLALLGGWRQNQTTVLHWQINRAGLEKLSIGTVVRSFFLEHEISRGAKKLMMYGGTPHTMRHAFERQTVADLVVRRQSLRGFALCAVSRLIARSGGLLGRNNFLALTLQDVALRWVSTRPVVEPERSSLLEPTKTEMVA